MLQVDLEPCGKLHLKIDLRWSQDTNPNPMPSRLTRGGGGTKDQPFLNRRRGAMRRRVHQVSKSFQRPIEWVLFKCQALDKYSILRKLLNLTFTNHRSIAKIPF